MHEYVVDSLAGNTLRRYRFDNAYDAIHAIAMLKQVWPDATGEYVDWIKDDNGQAIVVDSFGF